MLIPQAFRAGKPRMPGWGMAFSPGQPHQTLACGSFGQQLGVVSSPLSSTHASRGQVSAGRERLIWVQAGLGRRGGLALHCQAQTKIR